MSSKSARDSGLAIVMEEGDADEASDMAIAKQVAHALNRHYPDHLWQISVQGRGIVLRHGQKALVALYRAVAATGGAGGPDPGRGGAEPSSLGVVAPVLTVIQYRPPHAAEGCYFTRSPCRG